MLVQFGNNWIKKIPCTAKLILIQLFPNWTACGPVTYTNYSGGYSATEITKTMNSSYILECLWCLEREPINYMTINHKP